MGKFKLIKKVDLSSFGDDWKECVLSFTAPTFKDIKKISGLDVEKDSGEATEKAFDILKELFIEGTAFDGKEKVSVTKDDIDELPIEILIMCFKEISGTPNPN